MERPKPRRNVWRVVGWVAYGVALVGIGIGSTLYGWAKHNAPAFTDAAIKEALAPPQIQSVFGSHALTILLLGCDDSFTPSGKLISTATRSDMMMLVRVDFDHNTVSGLSIPRDTVLKLRGDGESFHRINAFHAQGGPELSRIAVEYLTKVKIDRVAKVDSWQFMEMVNSLGGVSIESPKPLEYTDHADGLYIRIKQGRNELNGYQALGFVRFRHGDDDISRGQRQRAFLLALRERMKANPTAALKTTDRLVPLFSKAFTQEELLSLMRMGIGMSTAKIKMAGWPVKHMPNTFALVTDRTGVPALLTSLDLNPTLGDPADTSPEKGAAEAFAKATSPDDKEPTIKIDVDRSGSGHQSKPKDVKKSGSSKP
ncbi:MAG: LCP family protein [bacterium]